MSIPKNLASKYTRLLTLWPTDPLRQFTFRTVLQKRLTKHNESASRTQATTTTTPPAPAPAPVSPQQQASEVVQINALFSLVEDRYATKYKLSEKYTRPRANPEYYARLMRELDEAPTRSRFSNWVRSWKGYLRWQ
ncbi:hypothetical protein EJ05DRAFT_476412 [Pseudovirgaria hyperparasitica]|uniref:Uncharacterized protein n=1 Tax=Pseudovirgaria hyperparasitica TaxID=470096 RepID=A0A6A6WAK6_9PEZI|nr:uncharacterized protein EJ05DRAFT_476412 [Pseudovirgaria hyperparasitica]KAF2758151.1 hypothetical protein EJ05DRAFT_476412 [Pseudovirgaria hyperparasitica]